MVNSYGKSPKFTLLWDILVDSLEARTEVHTIHPLMPFLGDHIYHILLGCAVATNSPIS